MAHFLAFQALPLAALYLLLHVLARAPRFERWGMASLFAAGAAVQLAVWIVATPALDDPDSLGFFRLAHGLEDDLRRRLYRPPLYPLFLGLFPGLKAAALAQCLLKLAMAALLWRISRLWGWRPQVSAFILSVFLLNSLWVQEPLRILDTSLFSLLFLACFWLASETLARPSATRFGALCAVAGLASLTRQVGDIALLPLVLFTAVRLVAARRLAPLPAGAGLLLGAALAFAGATYHLGAHGTFKRSVALGVNIYTHAAYFQLADRESPEWEFVEGRLPGERRRVAPWDPHWRHSLPWPANALPHRRERSLPGGTVKEIAETDRLLAARYFRWASGDPAAFVGSFLNEASRLLFKCEELYPRSLLGWGSTLPPLAARLERGIIHPPLYLLVLLGTVGAFVRSGSRPSRLAMGAGAALYLSLVAAIQMGFARYSLPAVPVLLALSGQALDALAERGSALAGKARDLLNRGRAGKSRISG